MSTPQTVKAQIKSLIATANATTGNTDTNLTSAVGSLVEGFGQGGEDTLGAMLMNTLESYSNNEITVIRQHAFYNCTSLVSVNLPNIETIENYAFSGCSSLKSINMPLLKRVPNDGFSRCSSLTKLDFPELISMSSNSFAGCINVIEVNFPKLQSVGYRSLNGLVSVQTMVFPSVTTIKASNCAENLTLLSKLDFHILNTLHGSAFVNCTNLNTLIIRTPTLCNLTSNLTLFADGTGYIYVPQALIEDYKVATNWSVFTDQFRAIEDYPEICGGDE